MRDHRDPSDCRQGDEQTAVFTRIFGYPTGMVLPTLTPRLPLEHLPMILRPSPQDTLTLIRITRQNKTKHPTKNLCFFIPCVDKVIVDVPPGDYVLGWRWDCEHTPQVWSGCADVRVVAPKGNGAPS